jgi:polysaccharide pyruvyl transferase WcaK-like protein
LVVGILAGYGNSSYGDYFVGMGLCDAIEQVGLRAVVVARANELSAFGETRCVIAGDRLDQLTAFAASNGRLFNALIVGGGGIFEDRVDAVLSQSLAAGYAARALWSVHSGLPVAVHGVGISPTPFRLRRTNMLLGELFRAAKRVGVRDHQSLLGARRFGVPADLVVDPAVISLSMHPIPRRERTAAAFIPFARRAWPRCDAPTVEDHARQAHDWRTAAERLADAPKIVVVPFHSSDLNFVDQIAAEFDVPVEVAPFTPDAPHRVLTVLAGCSRAVTMRYHGFMASHFAGIRDIEIIGSSQKLVVTKMLHDRGELPWDAVRAQRDVQDTLNAMS